MNLTLKKKFGSSAVHVRGGELVKVAQAHAVTTSTRSTSQEDWVRPPDDKKWVFCEVGDLAVEIVAVKTSKVLGHAYLSGPAIQLHRYTKPQDGWFAPATLELVELPSPPPGDFDMDAFFESFVGTMMKLKYGGLDIVALRATGAKNAEHLQQFGEFLKTAWSYVPVDPETDEAADVEATTHLVCVAEASKKAMAALHFQPPAHASEVCMTHFQVAMIVAAAERRAQDEK